MLTLPYRNLLVQTVPLVLPNWLDCKNLVNAVRAGSWDATVLIPFTYANAVPLLVDAADGQGWLRDLVQRLATTFPARLEFVTVLTEFDRAATPRTVLNPFDEVLLDGDRPFVNRQPLRTHLLNLTNPAGAAVLLVDGQPQTGKSFSFYLINHVAPTKGFVVHKFKMTSLPKPDELALDILYRLGVDRAIPPIGQESAERWAEKLAGVALRHGEPDHPPCDLRRRGVAAVPACRAGAISGCARPGTGRRDAARRRGALHDRPHGRRRHASGGGAELVRHPSGGQGED